MDELVNEIYDELSTELGISDETDLSMLLVKVKNAYREIKKIRNYPDNYTDNTVNKDMEKYFSNIRNLAMYDYNQIGAEGELSHSDNTGSRAWANRNTCLEGVVAICTLI